ncbi:MAG TPA: hypothetical protein PKD72_04455 [Gemmatales bacterium]|nr:hypothetical protein [Gemmatales bacterium]
MKVLDGAQDMEPFLSPNPVAIPEMQLSAKAEKDAEARYHLLQLSRDANPGALEADARTDFRYRALAQKPHEYRGELIKIRGDLISLGEPMELQRKVPGMDICYVGLIASEQADHQYLILFTDLPEGLPPMKEWSKLYIRNIEFSGYYYKVAKFTRAEGKIRTWMLPVLVGKTVQLPAQTNEGMEWFNLITVYLAMAIPVIFTALILPRYFRSSDKAHECLMQEYRQRRERRIQESLDEFNHH